MQAASQVRRAKLLALRKRRADEASGIVSDEGLAVKRSFRNYDPSTGRERRLAGPNELKHTVENDIHGIQQDTIAQDQLARAQDLDLTNIAPKRPNWDLKRDLDKRLHKLQRRDKQALLILIRTCFSFPQDPDSIN